MNKEQKCAVVRDLLPNYIEKLTSRETTDFVDQHLAECEACREVKRAMLGVVTPEEQAQSELLEGMRRARVRAKRRAWAIMICIALVLAVCLLPLPRPVNKTVDAVRWRPDVEEYEQITVEIRGTYMNFLFRTDYFEGDIAIEGLPQSQKLGRLSRVYCDGTGRPMFWADDQALLHAGAFTVTAPAFSEFMFGLYDENGSWDGESGINVTGPASTREEAIAITRRVCAKYSSWLSKGKWIGGQGEEN